MTCCGEAGAVDIVGVARYENQQRSTCYLWATDSIDGLSEIGFSHPRLQEEAFTWAAEQGATTLRPAKAVRFTGNGAPTVTVVHDDRETAYSARLVVGADGKTSAVRRWTGGESVTDPEHHRFGGVLVSGVQTDDRDTDNIGGTPRLKVNWFAAGAEHTRLYLQATAERLREWGADRSFPARCSHGALHARGRVDAAQQEGPIGFFPNSDTWASKITGNGVVLVGDAAGAPTRAWDTARHCSSTTCARCPSCCWLSVTGTRRPPHTGSDRAGTTRQSAPMTDGTASSMPRRAPRPTGYGRATNSKQTDPTLGGWALMEARGPDGLVADDAARRKYFGEDPSRMAGVS